MKRLLAATVTLAGLLSAPAAEAQCPHGYSLCEPVYFQDGTVMLVPNRHPSVTTDSRIAPAPTVPPFTRGRAVGLGVRVGAGYGALEGGALWGPGAAVRMMATPSFAFEIGVDAYLQLPSHQGTAPESAPIVVPLSASTIWFWNSRGVVQPFVAVGFAALVRRGPGEAALSVGADFHGATGVEIIIGRAVGISLEARAVLGFDDVGLTTAAVLATTGLTWYLPV